MIAGVLRNAVVATAVLAGSLVSVGNVAAAAPLGNAARCAAGNQPAVLVNIVGLKSRTGTLRVQSYGGDPAKFFDKGTWLERIEVPVPVSGPVSVCVPMPRAGTYAISVRHDANGNGKSDRADGGGTSGNPEVSLMDIVFKRKPAASKVAFAVGNGLRTIDITMNYVQGASFGPVRSATR